MTELKITMRIIRKTVLLLLAAVLALALSPASAETGTLSDRDISLVGEWSYEPLPSAWTYQTLTFRFTCAEDPTVYEACVAGIELEPAYGSLEDHIEGLMLAVADHFYSGEPMLLTSEELFTEKYHLYFQTIDAEKVHVLGSFGEKSDMELPDTDSLLCWAGSASDMLTFSGWGSAADADEFYNEDALYDFFEHAFTDSGADQTDGIKWFFNGVYPAQETDEAGAVIDGYENAGAGIAQEKWREGDKSGGLLPFYAAEAVNTGYNAHEVGYDPLMAAMLRMKDGCAIGFDIHFYADGRPTEASAHALTFMGYIRDTSKEGGDALRAIFYSDSDNDKTDGAARSELPNSLSLMNVEPSTVTLYGDTQVTYLAIPGLSDIYYDDDDRLTESIAHITGYHTLEGYDEASAARALEAEGSMDPLTDVDYIVEKCTVQDKRGNEIGQAAVGDRLLLNVRLTNRSYATLDLSARPYVMMTYTICREDEIVATRTAQVWFDPDSETPQGANKSYLVKIPTTPVLQTPGQYSVSIQIDGLYTGDGEPIAQAYTANDSSADYVLTVEGTAAGEEPELFGEETEVIAAAPTVGATFTRGASELCEVTLPGRAADGLELVEEHTLITEDVCEILDRDGDAVLRFSRAFIDETYCGLHPYLLQDADGAQVAWIEIHVEEDETLEDDEWDDLDLLLDDPDLLDF